MAAIYDEDNPDGPDHDFYRALAQELNAKTIVDLGCGTGILTVTLAGAGRKVTGIDPASAMLDVARAREGGNSVQWVQGYSSQIKPNSADLVLMTGNVAMHILGQAWKQTLSDIAQGLNLGGVLAFETRNPDARAWEKWNKTGRKRMTSAGVLHETTTVSSGVRLGTRDELRRGRPAIDHGHRIRGCTCRSDLEELLSHLRVTPVEDVPNSSCSVGRGADVHGAHTRVRSPSEARTSSTATITR